MTQRDQHIDGGITADTFDFDTWLATGTVARRSVEDHNNPGLVAEFDELERQLKKAKKDEKRTAGERAMGEASAVARIEAAMELLADQWDASKTTWIFRSLTEDERTTIADRYPSPPVPKILKKKHPAGSPAAKKREAAAQRWLQGHEAAETLRNLAMISQALVEIRTAKGAKVREPGGAPLATLEQLQALRAEPHYGKERTAKFLAAVVAATTGEADVPRPSSPADSAGDQD